MKVFESQIKLIDQLAKPWATHIDRPHRRIECYGTSNVRFFDKISQNALQNVMQFFEQWGPDFVKMRVINKKTKSAYMGYVSSYAKLENYLDTVD